MGVIKLNFQVELLYNFVTSFIGFFCLLVLVLPPKTYPLYDWPEEDG